MIVDEQSTVQEASTSTTPDLGALAFSDYEKVRRGESLPEPKAKAAPAKAEQKDTEESAPSETEAKDDVLDAESEESDEAADAKDKPKKSKGGFQRRIDKLNARYAAAQAEIEHWKSMALKENSAGESKGAKVEPAQAEAGKPKAADFETHEEYVEALADWKLDQREKKRAEDERQKSVLSEQEKLQKSHMERVKAFAEKHEDFMELLAEADEVAPLSPAVQQIILESENGPALMYELAKNPKEYARICGLSPLAAAREMGKIETRLSASEEKKPETKLTKAPKPLTTIGKGGASTSKSLDDPNLSFADYERLRREQMKRRR